MAAQLPIDRIQPPKATIADLRPGESCFVHIAALMVNLNRETYIPKETIQEARLDSLTIRFGLDEDGKYYADLQSSPDYKFRREDALVKMGLSRRFLIPVDYFIGV